MRRRLVAPVALAVAVLGGCDAGSPPDINSSTAAERPEARESAQRFLDALIGSAPCADVLALAILDGGDQASFCAELRDYREQVRALTLGAVTDAADDLTIFAVRVDYLNSPPITDSEIEVDQVDGQPVVAASLP